MNESAETLTLGVIAAIVAGNTEAVSHMLVALAAVDAKQADAVMQAIARGTNARTNREVGSHDGHQISEHPTLTERDVPRVCYTCDVEIEPRVRGDA